MRKDALSKDAYDYVDKGPLFFEISQLEFWDYFGTKSMVGGE